MKRAILLVILLLPETVDAADRNGKYKGEWWTPNHTCADYVAARDEARKGNPAKENDFRVWLMGYLTAYNSVTPDTWDITRGLELNELSAWLERLCKGFPSDDFGSAMEVLIHDLYPKRIRKSPKLR